MTTQISSRLVEIINQAVLKQVKQLELSLTPLVENISESLLKSIAPIIEQATRLHVEIEKASSFVGPPLRQAGFWIPDHASQDFVSKLFHISAKSNSTKKIRELFVYEYHSDNFRLLNELVESLEENKYFRERMTTIRLALAAHERGEYGLSIPALLPVIEGILVSIAGPRKQRLYEYAGTAIDERYSDIFPELSKNAILEFVTGISFYGDVKREYFYPDFYDEWLKTQGLEPRQCLNRHAILHGVQKEYASPENSLRAFLLLDVLAEIAQPSKLTFSELKPPL